MQALAPGLASLAFRDPHQSGRSSELQFLEGGSIAAFNWPLRRRRSASGRAGAPRACCPRVAPTHGLRDGCIVVTLACRHGDVVAPIVRLSWRALRSPDDATGHDGFAAVWLMSKHSMRSGGAQVQATPPGQTAAPSTRHWPRGAGPAPARALSAAISSQRRRSPRTRCRSPTAGGRPVRWSGLLQQLASSRFEFDHDLPGSRSVSEIVLHDEGGSASRPAAESAETRAGTSCDCPVPGRRGS